MNDIYDNYAPAPAAAKDADKVERALKNIAQHIVTLVFGLLPIFFIPLVYAPLGNSKIFFVIVGVFVAIIFFSLSTLRSGNVRFSAPFALWGLWGVAIATVLSALLSGDLHDSLIGDGFGVQTAAFLGLIALIATVMSVLDQSKASIMRLYFLLTSSAVLLTVYHVLRLVFGPEFLSFGIFTGLVSSPIGGWNDLGLLFGLIILLALVALEQLPLTKSGQVFFSIVVALSLTMLMVVNFSAVWVVLGLVSLVVLMYSLTKDRFAKSIVSAETSSSSLSVPSVVVSTAVFLVSLLCIIGGSTVSGFVTNVTGVSYVEVRPSVEATLDLAGNIYSENMFVGIGPNKFVDAWKLYKDPSLNQTIFWDTQFTSGSGYIPTMLATTGIVGVVAWILFLGLFLRSGFRMLFSATSGDKFWYFIGSSSFVAAVYLWGMSIIYVPGASVLLLAGIFTSIVFTAHSVLIKTREVSLSVAANRRSGIVLVGAVMIVIVIAVAALFYTGRQYSAILSFNQAISSVENGDSVEVIEQKIAAAYNISPNDLFARQIAQYQLAKLNALLSLQEPTAEQQEQFSQSVTNGINAARLAITQDATEPTNHALLGSIYSLLAGVQVEGAKEEAQLSYSLASQFDPLNPSYALLEAQLLYRTGDIEGARNSVIKAIQLKNNYAEALAFLTELEISAGNVNEAIATTEAMVSLDPNNPGRQYQLGVLNISAGNTEDAVAPLERAVSIDNNYANARYFLALVYADLGRTNDAVAQLEVVLELNPGNEDVANLINQLQEGSYTGAVEQSSETQVDEPNEVLETDNGVITTQDPETSLITPVNVVPDESIDEDFSVSDQSVDSATTTNEDTVQ